MIASIHFLRPGWLLAIIPFMGIAFSHWRTRPPLAQGWSTICDPHLLTHLLSTKKGISSLKTSWLLLMAALWMILALAGPSWMQLPVPTYKKIQPLVILLEMSEEMAQADVTPNRLQRAKFILHDIFQHAKSGQFGLIAFSQEPFVVSPLTDDAQTIDALLPALSLDIMPVGGSQMERALQQAAVLIEQAGFHEGKVLILSASLPTDAALRAIRKLAQQDIHAALLPIRSTKENSDPGKRPEAIITEDGGKVFSLTTPANDLIKWAQLENHTSHFIKSDMDLVPLWRDEGRWFLWPALMCLLPVFRRGSLSL